jgi:hypothetical protein
MKEIEPHSLRRVGARDVGCKTRSCYVIGSGGADSKTILADFEAGSLTYRGAK